MFLKEREKGWRSGVRRSKEGERMRRGLNGDDRFGWRRVRGDRGKKEVKTRE